MKKLLILFALILSVLLSAAANAEDGIIPAEVAAGDIISFGNYEQDNDHTNGPEPIVWIVLDVVDEKALLLSKYGLDSKPYHDYSGIITWEDCTLRYWLNNFFLNEAFNTDEQTAIVITEVDNSANQGYSGWRKINENNTQDRIFLLSFAEADKYLGIGKSKKTRVAPTDYAIQNGAWTSSVNQTADHKRAGWWWLRSPADSLSYAAGVDDYGLLYYSDTHLDDGVVRPALWLDLNSDN